MTGEFGLCGYFKEYDRDLEEHERLQFAKGELPPEFKVHEQPQVPQDEWDSARLEKANRNYAMNYIRNGISELKSVIGEDRTRELASRAARLIGLQYFSETAATIRAKDGNLEQAAEFLAQMFRGMGDTVIVHNLGRSIELHHSGFRVIRDLPDGEAALVFDIWSELWIGMMFSQREMKHLEVVRRGTQATWILSKKA